MARKPKKTQAAPPSEPTMLDMLERLEAGCWIDAAGEIEKAEPDRRKIERLVSFAERFKAARIRVRREAIRLVCDGGEYVGE